MSEVDTVQRGAPPRHVAIIMDGNGRWAKLRNKPRVFGHQKGAKSVYEIVEYSARQGIKELTLFAFSSENWNRPEDEVASLMKLFSIYIKREGRKLHKNNIKFVVIGDKSRFSSSLQESINNIETLTINNSQMTLNLALNYGGRWDICEAVKKISSDILKNKYTTENIDEELIKSKLYTSDVDLMIRTGGESRISNFLLYQSAYAEFYFTQTLWPDFGANDLKLALDYFSKRERRFGLISEQLKRDC